MNFQAALKVILKHEGGFVNHPNDPGGATNWGITKRTLEGWLGRSVTIDEVKNLSIATAGLIYKARYWDAMNLDLVKDGWVRLLIFDQGVNRGPKSAVLQAQAVLKKIGAMVKVDGALGPITVQALNEADPVTFMREYLQASEHFYADICIRKPSQIVFLKGWLNRVHSLQDVVWAGGDGRQYIGSVSVDEGEVLNG